MCWLFEFGVPHQLELVSAGAFLQLPFAAWWVYVQEQRAVHQVQ